MKNPLFRKLMMIVGLTLLLCIPLRLVGVTVWERSSARDAVRTDIADSMAGEQWLAGPVLVLPYRELVFTRRKDDKGVESVVAHWENRSQAWLPERLEIRGTLENSTRHRGIYEARLYQGELSLKAAFDLRRKPAVTASENLVWGRPYLALGVADVRGISEMPRGSVNGEPLAFDAGPGLAALGSGVHAPVALEPGGHMEVALDLSLRGMERLDVVPLGGDSLLALKSNWPHPSFQGRYLPDHSEIGKDGFAARWRTTFLATSIEQQFDDCIGAGNRDACGTLLHNTLGVKLVQPVDIYLQSERALKYGFLFVGLAFGVFFFFEVLKGLRIHAMQYSLVGFALTLFFLLVVALSEHIRFALAYAAAASACTALLAFYVSYVLRSAWRGLGFASLMGLLFGVLYALLQSEDYALLMGALLLFVLLAVVMILTRRLDWFAVGEGEAGVPAGRGRA